MGLTTILMKVSLNSCSFGLFLSSMMYYTACTRKMGTPDLLGSMKFSKKMVSDKSFKVWKEASDGELDYELRAKFRVHSKVNLTFLNGNPYSRHRPLLQVTKARSTVD